MKTMENKLSSVQITRMREQGYFNQSENELNQLAFGNRFAYRGCVSILIVELSMVIS